MQLPKSLRSWAEILSQFPEEIALVLGGLALKVNRLIGAIEQEEQVGHETPDGYEGISRKGPYERLLISEWMFAEEIPDEFNRRLSMNEHLFTQLKLQTKRNTSKTIVLFDAGPFQLGAPRIAQLALLIVMARRAERSKCEFLWGILQDAKSGLHSSIDNRSVMSFLSARSTDIVTQDMKKNWESELEQQGKVDDMWVIGAENMSAYYTEYSRVLIDESWETKSKDVILSVKQKNTNKVLALTMPEDEICARLLRDPYLTYSVTDYTKASSISLDSEIIFSANGRRLAYYSNHGQVISYPIPNSPKCKLAKPKSFTVPDDHELLAVTIRKKGISVITKSTGSLYFHRLASTTLPFEERHNPQNIVVDNTGGRLNQFHIINNGIKNTNDIYLVDNKSNLRLINHEKLIATVAKGVTGFGCINNGIYYSTYNKADGELEVYVIQTNSITSKFKYLVNLTNASQVTAYEISLWSKNKIGLLLAKISKCNWFIVFENKECHISLKADVAVIGAIIVKENSINVPALVAVKGNNEIFYITEKLQEKTILTSKIEITVAKVNPHRREIVYVNKRKEIVVYSLDRSLETMHVYAGDDL